MGPSDGGSNVFGNAVADAGMILADAMSKQQDVGRLARAERLNAKLQKQVTDLTLRPVVPGVYGEQNGGSYTSQGGARNAGSAGLDPRSSGNSGDVGQSLPRVNPIAPGREVDVLPVPNSPGVFEVDNAATGGPITIPGDTEPWVLMTTPPP